MVMVACSLTCCCCVSLDEIRTEIVSGKEFAKRIMMLLDWIGNYEKDCVGRSLCTLMHFWRIANPTVIKRCVAVLVS